MLVGHGDLVALLLAGVGALIVVFVLLLVWFKIRRDQIETASHRLREDLLASWRSGDEATMTAVLGAVATGHTRHVSDFAAALASAADDEWFTSESAAALAIAVQDSGLGARLDGNLTSRLAARRGLAVFLGGYAPTHVPPDHLAAFLRDPNPTVRLAAVRSLGHQRTGQAATALIDALAHRTLPTPRIVERLAYPWAVPTIVEALKGTGLTPHARAALLQALAISGEPASIDVALRELEEGGDEERIQAARVLAQCTARADSLQRQIVGDTVTRLADDPLPMLRSLAMTTLVTVDHPARIETLTRGAQDRDWFVRRAAARALAATGPEGIARLEQLSRGMDAFAAERAREQLALVAAENRRAHDDGTIP